MRGFTLVEVLVALFVVAVGLVGAAALHTRSQRAATEAAYLSSGVQLAAALAERMRANPVAMARPDGANPYLPFDFDATDGDPPAAAPCFAGADCDAIAIARFDLAETAAALAESVPGGRIVACRDGAGADPSGPASWTCDGQPGASVVIKIGWRGGASAGQAAAPAMPAIVVPVVLPAVLPAVLPEGAP